MEPNGYLLNDCHAEVLARRSLQKSLSKELLWHLKAQNTEKAFLLSEGSKTNKFRLKHGVKLHMYVSEPPCGDASMI